MKRIPIPVAACAAAVFAAALAAAPATAADVHIGINIAPPVIAFDAPPRLVVVPGVPHVHYAPDVSVNYFTYEDRYYTYDSGHWFVAYADHGPWTYVERSYVPAPVLRVPSRYYRVPPRLVGGGHWNHYNSSRHYTTHKGDWHGGGNGNGKGHKGNGHGNGRGHGKHH